jgi:hypothetical protein
MLLEAIGELELGGLHVGACSSLRRLVLSTE